MLLSLLAAAWPCSEPTDDLSVVPGLGPLPAGTALRVSADGVEGELLDAVDQDTDLVALPVAAGWTALFTPEDLPPGDHRLNLTAWTGSGQFAPRTFSFVEGPPGGALDADPAYLGHTEALAADPCAPALGERLVVTLTWSLPPAPGPGWVARLSDDEGGEASPFYSLEEGAELVRELAIATDPAAPAQVCPVLEVWDATHARVDGWSQPCITPEAPGCATAAGRRGLALALLGLALARRRRVG